MNMELRMNYTNYSSSSNWNHPSCG